MVDSVSSGDVAVAVGLPHAATGDTLVGLRSGLGGLQLDGVAIPPPVFSLAVEAESSRQQVRTEKIVMAIAPLVLVGALLHLVSSI